MKPLHITLGLGLCCLSLSASGNSLKERSLDMLYKYMPAADSTNYSRVFFVHNVDMSLRAREEMPWGKNVPEREFLHFVVPVRVNNEALDNHREVFYNELKDRVKDMSMKDAILEINHWCHEKVTYQPSDGRTHSPLASVSSAIGRCGEESTFGVAALRAMGIPARQVYTPRWAHTDDNHAWVEAWADGHWYFLGACEPEPVLNLGWFNAPASRGMLMHARVFGPYRGEEEILSTADGITDINVTDHYAPVDTLTVNVTDKNGKPLENVDVTFRIYNYAEFYPIASKQTDSEGHASIVAGLGDVLVWATDGTDYNFVKCKVGDNKIINLTLDGAPSSGRSFDMDVVPPAAAAGTVTVTAEQRAENNRRFAIEDSIRNAYTSTFATGSDSISVLYAKARGNHQTIRNFYTNATDKAKAYNLLASLREKDLTDVTEEVLLDHYAAVDNGSTLFAEYIMSPRIGVEELTPFRAFFKKAIPQKEQTKYRKNPALWAKWVKDNIDGSDYWYPVSVLMNPTEVWNHRKTSAASRDLFFVAAARAMGIPARIESVTGKPQWADSKGNWHDVNFKGVQKKSNTPQHKLTMTYDHGSVVEDPLYYTHFSLSKIENGEPKLLNYPDFIPLSQSFAKSELLDEGEYMLVTGQRLADGGVLSHIDFIDLTKGDVTMPLTLRSDSSQVQVVGNFDAETRFTPDNGSEQSLLATTGRGYYVLALVRPGNEPSNHALRDMATLKEKLEANGTPIVILTEDAESREKLDYDILASLPSTTTLGYDSTGNVKSALTALAKSDEAPIIIITDTFNRVVFTSSGYNIGLGQKLLDILRRL